MQDGGNAGFLSTQDDLAGSTTASHENGHGLVYRNESNTVDTAHTISGQDEKTAPSIMTARGAKVNSKWSDKSGKMNPNTRRVNNADVNNMLRNVRFTKSGKGQIGRTTNTIYTENGAKKTN